MKKENRNNQLHFFVTESEMDGIASRMTQLGITNLSAYLRKMALDGFIIQLDMTQIQEMTRLLRICSNNLNQYSRRANETCSIYEADIEDLKERMEQLWDGMEKLLHQFANIP